MPQSSTLSTGMDVQKDSTLFLDAGVFGSNAVREVPGFFKTMATEGLQGGKGDTHEVEHPQPSHHPGIQPEACVIF
jgi:hypothetical protein